MQVKQEFVSDEAKQKRDYQITRMPSRNPFFLRTVPHWTRNERIENVLEWSSDDPDLEPFTCEDSKDPDVRALKPEKELKRLLMNV